MNRCTVDNGHTILHSPQPRAINCIFVICSFIIHHYQCYQVSYYQGGVYFNTDSLPHFLMGPERLPEGNLEVWGRGISHSLIIIREVLILTLSISNDMICTDYIFQYTPWSPGSVSPNTAHEQDTLPGP